MVKRVAASRKQTWSWQLKIELLGVTPSVWRRITVPETITDVPGTDPDFIGGERGTRTLDLGIMSATL
jgi:hypothetical protein